MIEVDGRLYLDVSGVCEPALNAAHDTLDAATQATDPLEECDLTLKATRQVIDYLEYDEYLRDILITALAPCPHLKWVKARNAKGQEGLMCTACGEVRRGS